MASININSYEDIEKILTQISDRLDPDIIQSITKTDMYNKTYMYTLNRYRNLILTEAQKYTTLNIESKYVDLYLLNKMKTHYFPDLKKTCEYIESIPLIEQKTPAWFKQRETMISASDAGYFLKTCGVSRAISTLKIKVGLRSFPSSSCAPLMHGNTYEDVTRAIYESRNSVSVTEYGIVTSPTSFIGASPDGIVTACHKDTYECCSKYGRLLEIKNPYSREIDTTVKPEYMVQILQQNYTMQLPICDFVETTIVDMNCHAYTSSNKPYTSLDEMLEDKLDRSHSNWEKRVKNKNIPLENLNKFGNEKGLIVWYKKIINENDTRHKYILYPLNAIYEKESIEKWIIDTNGDQFKDGFLFITTKFWRLDIYSEKTVIYDQSLFESDYIPRLSAVWDSIVKCKDMILRGYIIEAEAYIDDLENQKESPFYNENKRKKKQKVSNSDLNTYNPSNSIELDF
jgi:hypothetical protein